MQLRRSVLAVSALVLLLVAVAGAGLLWLKAAPRSTPRGQPALARLDTRSLPAFSDTFNREQGRARLILLLSPT